MGIKREVMIKYMKQVYWGIYFISLAILALVGVGFCIGIAYLSETPKIAYIIAPIVAWPLHKIHMSMMNSIEYEFERAMMLGGRLNPVMRSKDFRAIIMNGSDTNYDLYVSMYVSAYLDVFSEARRKHINIIAVNTGVEGEAIALKEELERENEENDG